MKQRKTLLDRAKNLYEKTKWRAHWLAPNKIPPPGLRFDSEDDFFDSEENFNTQIPKDVEISLKQIYAMELYGPAEIESLYTKLKELNWRQDSFSKRPGPDDWIRRQRAYGRGNAWFKLGAIIRRKDRGNFLALQITHLFPTGLNMLI